MSNKTISINPSLFSIGKTKKKREKIQKAGVTLISPNVLRNKLLKRIKEHKLKETETLDKKKLPESKSEETTFSDEFSNSINYLQTLSNMN